MPKAVVLADNLAYYEKDEDGNRVRQTVAKGAEVDLSQADFDRHLRDGAIEKPSAAAASEPEALSDLTVAELDDLAEQQGVEEYPKSGSKAEKVAHLEANGVELPADES